MARAAGARTRPGPPRHTPVTVTLVAAIIGVAVTVVTLALPALSLTFRSASLHLVLETVDAGVALLVAYLVYGRWRRTEHVQDLLLFQGLLLLALASLGIFVLVRLTGAGREGVLDVWLPLAVRVLGSTLIALAAVTGGRRHGPRLQRSVRAAPLALAVVLIAVLTWTQSGLPMALDPESSPRSAAWRSLPGYPALPSAYALMMVCFVVASVGFTVQARRRPDELVTWLGPACALAASARLSYVLFPSNYSDWFYTGDLLRTGFYLLLLVGAGREIRGYWAAQAEVAVVEDRRRLARELHDGVLQELGYIRTETRRLSTAELSTVDRVVAACDRAVDEARAAVDAMGRASDEPLGFVLHRSLRQVAERYATRLELEIDDAVAADGPGQRHALLRIAREAVANAARHGSPTRVKVELTQRDGVRSLVIQDDGVGFDAASAAGQVTGFGLVSMRDRAAGLPGALTIDSRPGVGTTVTVRW